MERNDQIRVRDLAKRQQEVANSPEMQALKKEWTDLNDGVRVKPLVTVETATFVEEAVPQLMRCTTEEGRRWEHLLLCNLINHDYFGDDTVVRDFIPVTYNSFFKPFDIDVQIETTEGLGHHFVPVISDLETDFEKLKPSSMGVSPKEEAKKRVDEINEALDGILPGRIVGQANYAVLTQNIVHIMSMEDMYLSMYDQPERFHEMMKQLADDYCRYYDLLEEQGVLLPTVSSEPLGQGTYCFTNDLPNQDIKKTSQIWGFMDSQETAGISPEMFETFIFPYYQKVFSRFGLLSYGCCEAVDPIWESCLSKVENLRKVSISPWCNEEYMGEQLRNRKIVYHRKPSPNFLGVGERLDEEALRGHIRKTLKAVKGCALEFTQRDVYTIHHDLGKVKRYVEIIKEECERF